MPAIISGIAFNDLNSNGIYNTGEPGVPNAFITLINTSGSCTQVQTDINGNYSFTNISVAGVYTIYETVTTPNGCPPTLFTQPSGFNESTTPRQINLTVTSTQINNNTTISGNNFGHDNLTANGCTPFAYQVQGSPTTFTQIDLKTGSTSTLGTLNPSSTMAGTGFNAIDGNFWGYNGTTSRVSRITQNRTVTDLPAIPNLPIPINYNNGDVNSNGYLYLYSSAATNFYVVDVNPNRVTYGRLVNPATGFSEQTTTPFGVTIGTAINIADWAFNPKDGLLYGVDNNTGIAVRINPTTGAVTNLTTSPQTTTTFGASFFDNNNNLYEIDNNTGQVIKFALSGNTATRTLFSQSVASGQNDGARCATAPITFAFLSSTKSSPGNVAVGETFTYTIAIKNTGNTTSTNCIFIDTIPNGASFISNTLKINNVLINGSPEPPGIELGSIPVGTTTVTFNVIVTTIPSPNAMLNNSTSSYSYQDGIGGSVFSSNAYSNQSVTTVNYAFLPMIKYTNRQTVAIGNQISYTIVLTNSGNYTASNIVIIDTIPTGTTYVSGSLSGGTGSPSTGISVSNIIPNAVSTITFSVLVTTVPSPNQILNNSAVTFNLKPNSFTVNGGNTSNTVNTTVYYVNIGFATKLVDKNYADCGDILNYTIIIPNTGNTTALNVRLIDTIPNGTQFQNNSVKVNSNPQSNVFPNLGISIPDIIPNGIATVTFQVKVTC